MEFLKELGFNDLVLHRIINSNDDSVIYNFIMDCDNVRDVINYFREIGIEVIDELLVRRLEVFSIDISKLKKQFDKYNIGVLVSLINEDISAINFL